MRWPDLAAAQAAVSAALGSPADLRMVDRPMPARELSPGERAAYARLPATGRRRADWLLGRTALRLVLDWADTSEVTFPDRCLSVAHAGGVGVAARCRGPQVGAGVDFEAWRPVNPRAGRFFLLDGEGDDATDLLRLWTVKEALYKATPDNRRATLLDYRLQDVRSGLGRATDTRGNTFTYVSGRLPTGPLTVAVCEGAADGAF